jgi:tRNA 2-thiouridine synthesizing protein A
MFASSSRPIFGLGTRTTGRGGHDEGREGARMTGRRLRLFGRGPAARRTDPTAGSVPLDEPERAVAPPPGLAPTLTIDALGRKCPIPIIMLAEQIRDVPLGAIVSVLADDPAAYTDVPAWCAMKAQEFVCAQDLPRGWALFIRRTV